MTDEIKDLLVKHSEWSADSGVTVSLGALRKMYNQLGLMTRAGTPMLLALERLETVFDVSHEIKSAIADFRVALERG